MSNTIWISSGVGAATALGLTLIKDIVLPRVNARYAKKQTETELFQEYLKPITISLEALMWRFNEILKQEGRGVYLQKEGSGSQYAEYKRVSTVYRLCVSIAWFRAFERELLNIRLVNSNHQDRLREAMKKFQIALADGKSVELIKFDRLVAQRGLAETFSETDRELLAIKVENLLDGVLGDEKHKGLAAASFEEQRETIKKVIALISNGDNSWQESPLSNDEVAEAVKILSLRQTWIYRDWQSAIGDAMLRENSAGPRKFNVIGYGEFEELWKRRPLWLERISALVLDFDVIDRDPNDARVEQLEGILRTVSELVAALLTTDTVLERAMPATLKKAMELSG